LTLTGIIYLRRTIISRIVNSTPLPSLLRTDPSAGHHDGVSSNIVAVTYLSLLTAVILAIAQVLAPIGLSERVIPIGLTNITFDYAPDPSAFGVTTYQRDNYILARSCGNKPCPGVPARAALDHDWHGSFATTVPQNITDCFTSGTSSPGDLRASSFEIEFRQFIAQNASHRVQDLSVYLDTNVTGLFDYLAPVTSVPGYHVKEGVVIDAIDGGVGFRNHTVPTSSAGAAASTWSEDLLWVVPVTSCVQTDWTIHSRMRLLSGSIIGAVDVQDVFLAYDNHTPKSAETFIDPQGPFRFDQRLQDASMDLDKRLATKLNRTLGEGSFKIPVSADLWFTTDFPLLYIENGIFSFPTYRPRELWSIGNRVDSGHVLSHAGEYLNLPSCQVTELPPVLPYFLPPA